MFRKLKGRVVAYKEGVIDEAKLAGALQSYLGVFSHADAHQLSEDFKNQSLYFWLW